MNATGSGKATSAKEFFSQHAKDDAIRLLTMEEGSREFDLIQEDENGVVLNDVLRMLTTKNDNDNMVQKLLAHPDSSEEFHLAELLLKFNPTLLGIGEMRSEGKNDTDSKEALETR